MNLNHALIVGELAGNTNFALVLLCAPVQTIYVCICAWIDKEPAVEEKCAVLGTLCNVKMEKSGGGRELCFPWTRVSPLSSRPPSLLATLLVARRTRASNGITFCPSFSLSRTKYRFPVSALLRE